MFSFVIHGGIDPYGLHPVCLTFILNTESMRNTTGEKNYITWYYTYNKRISLLIIFCVYVKQFALPWTQTLK